MEYSLNYLNNTSKLEDLTLTYFIDKLNIIGFEVDDIFIKKLKSNNYCNTISLLLKIPSNREDLMIQSFLENELKTIFLFEFYNTWKIIKPDYSFVLKEIYSKYRPLQLSNIIDPFKATVYYKIQIENYKELESPLWVKNKLENNGFVSQNLLPDLLSLTNFEYGSTINLIKKESLTNLHLEKISKNEFFKDLNNNLIEVPQDTLVVKSNDKIISILGYTNQKVLQNSNTFELEYIYYDIHQNKVNLSSVNTRLSLRYLRKSYLENYKKGFERLLSLIELLTPFQINSNITCLNNNQIELTPLKIIKLKKLKLKNILNLKQLDLEIFKIAGLTIICETPTELYFNIPIFRNDLEREIDLIEEYSRFIGYKNFEQIKPIKNLIFSKRKRKNVSFIKQYFLNNNFFEVFTNSLIDNDQLGTNYIKLTNPLNKELALLRNDLISNLIPIFENSLRSGFLQKKFFEIGRVFKIHKGKIIEQEKVGCIFQLDRISNIDLDWFYAKGFLENLLTNFGFDDYSFQVLESIEKNYHPTRSILIKSKNKVIGKFGELHPEIRQNIIAKSPIYIFEINLIYLNSFKLNNKIKIYNDSSKYPQITKDLSFVIQKETDLYQIKKFIKENVPDLKAISFFDLYFNKTNEKTVSVAINLQFQSKTTTLISENIEKELENLKVKLIKQFNIEFKV
jgi:phenylalanyl-tRNA synthetase beta chain